MKFSKGFKVDILCFIEQVRIAQWALQNMFITQNHSQIMRVSLSILNCFHSCFRVSSHFKYK